MATLRNAAPRRAGGFGMVEILVTMVIALIVVVAMMSQFATFEDAKRNTTGGADAQTTGAIALYAIERDLRESGLGIAWPTVFSCTMTLSPGGTVPMVPVVINPATSIVPAGDANTDTLLVIYGSSNTMPHPNEIVPPGGSPYAVQLPRSFTVGDVVVAVPDSCSAALVPAPVTAVGASSITAASGSGSWMYNLGPTPSIVAYAVRDGNLTMCDFSVNNCSTAKASLTASQWASQWVPIATNVVSLRAQYGLDTTTPRDGIVDTYNQTTPTTACGWSSVAAVRMVVVARSPLLDKGDKGPSGVDPTPNAPTWEGSSGAPVNLSADTNWKKYRYRTFETTVPMRNLVWLTNAATLAQRGC